MSSTSMPPTHSTLLPPLIASLAHSSRIAPHSHTKALSLTPEGLATTDGASFIEHIRETTSTSRLGSGTFTYYFCPF
jgi:hypothetical protein